MSLNSLEETEAVATPPIDTELIQKSDNKKAMAAAKKLLDSGALTEVQRRRFILHFLRGYSYRKIAAIERVFFTSVAESITAASYKLKKYFENF